MPCSKLVVPPHRWMQLWLGLGLFWFLLAIALAPSNKLYQQGMIAFVWLPALLVIWPQRDRLVEVWRAQRGLCIALLALGAWAGLSLLWTQEDQVVREFKRLFYIALFLALFPVLANGDPQRLIRCMQWAGVGLAGIALWSIVQFYVLAGNSWLARMEGMGRLSHPILGGYVIGLAAVWMMHWTPSSRALQVLWGVCLVFLASFVLLCQSRGAGLALLFTALVMPVWRRDRYSLLVSAMAVLVILAAWLCFEPLLMARGVSYRPQIFMASLDMIAAHPWLGLGMGANYVVSADAQFFDHAHNLFTHVGIELGLPGILLWALVWLLVLRYAWQARACGYGQGLIGIWLFSFLAMQFDAASLTGTPRPEWFISWLPVGLATVLTWVRASQPGVIKSHAPSNL